MRFLNVHLRAAAAVMADQQSFYVHRLGLPTHPVPDGFAVRIGETAVAFGPGTGEPFYHFALLVPGDRFDAAMAWINERVALLPHQGAPADHVVFDFPAWNAQACYFHDPTGNIVELIAHRDRGAGGATGAFAASELLGISELGLVGQPTTMAAPLGAQLGLEVWDGRVADDAGLAFVGAPARTLILVPTGRGWLPTGRPAERHPVQAVLSVPTGVSAQVELESGLYRIRTSPHHTGPGDTAAAQPG